MTPATFRTELARRKLPMCISLARECRRDARSAGLTPRERRELRRVAAEAMQDARYWRDELRAALANP